MFIAKVVDVADDKLINSEIENPRNITIRAVDAETMEGFTADFGYTYYPYPHATVYRPAPAQKNYE